MNSIVVKITSRVKNNKSLFWGEIGALVYAGFFVLSLADQQLFSYMGVTAQPAVDMIRKLFWQDILLIQAKILGVYMILGFLCGLAWYYFWSALLGARFWLMRLRGKLPVMVLSLVATEVFFLVASMLKYPQVYSEYFHERSPWRQALQEGVTAHLQPVYFYLTICFLLLLFIVFLFRRWSWLVRMIAVSLAGSALIVWGLLALTQKTYRQIPAGLNVIIISADSLRNDYVTDELTPNLISLAQQGTRFQQCYVSLPRTFPQWITYLKSQYPSQHGVRNMFPEKSLREQDQGSLCTVLKKYGYRTAVVSDFAGDVFSRFQAGFDIVKTPYFNFNTLIEQRCLEMHYLLLPYILNQAGRDIFPVLKEMANNADPIVLEREAEKIIAGFKGRQNFFLVLFSSVTHFPYAAPYPYYSMFTKPGYQGRYKYYKPNIPGESLALPPADLAQIRGLYKGAVRSLDDMAGRLMTYLEKNNLDQNTIIIVLSDHGEQLYEHGWGQGHGEHLRGRAVLNVPLIIKKPGASFPVQESGSIVRDIDVAPTILDLLHIPAPPTMAGVSLLPLARGTTSSLNLTAFAETGLWFTDKGDNFYQQQRIMYPDIISLGEIDSTYNNEVVVKPEYRSLTTIAKHRMIRTERYKLIYIPTRQGMQFELYDTYNDPQELNNIAAQESKTVAMLKNQLFQWMSLDKHSFWRNGYLVPYQ
ncbi:MAG: sulfatase-like hydrolase/transferase [bacterium]|nr:sulfatase-like hydrolase/transferase [bacterium]MDD5353737.1 sulfatase-like hydrolase/transferase [bacterium]MDD5755899.1 sulfatase-like hydrolase/transferase [bacterium]